MKKRKNRTSRFYYVWILAYNDRLDEAFELTDRSAEATQKSVFSKLCLLLKYAFLRDGKKVSQLLSSGVFEIADKDHGWAYLVSAVLLHTGLK